MLFIDLVWLDCNLLIQHRNGVLRVYATLAQWGLIFKKGLLDAAVIQINSGSNNVHSVCF